MLYRFCFTITQNDSFSFALRISLFYFESGEIDRINDKQVIKFITSHSHHIKSQYITQFIEKAVHNNRLMF